MSTADGPRVGLGRLDVLQSLDGVEPGLDVLELLEARGIAVLNRSAALMAAHDKLSTETLLAAARIPRLPARHVVDAAEVRRLPLPLVLKPRFGSWGRDVVRCRDANEREQCLAAITERGWFVQDGGVAQPRVSSPGFDLRLIVARGMTVGAVERVARPGEWRTNVSLGGTIRGTRPSTQAREIAAAAAGAAFGADLVGVDLIPTPDGYRVLELNGAVEFDDRYSLESGDVYGAAAHALGLGTRATRQTAAGRTR